MSVQCNHCGDYVAEKNAVPCHSPYDTWHYCKGCDYSLSGQKAMKTCDHCNKYGKHRDGVCAYCGFEEETCPNCGMDCLPFITEGKACDRK